MTGFEPAPLGLGGRLDVGSLLFAIFRRRSKFAPILSFFIFGVFAVVRRTALPFAR